MAIPSVHPKYADIAIDWTTLRDLYKGDRQVKAKGDVYLPATAGMKLDGMGPNGVGLDAYNAYKARAVVPDYIREGVEILVGLLHQKNAIIELPAEMESLRDKATINGETLVALHRRINVEQLITGRVGLLVDLPEEPDPTTPLPYIALYAGEAVINWDDNTETSGFNAINMVVLNESKYERANEFDWKWMNAYRVLQLGPMLTDEPEGTTVYKQGFFTSETEAGLTYSEADMIIPMLRGKSLESIPFTFINTKDLLAAPDQPPLMGLANLCLTVYRTEADYRQSLYMQGQDTLVVIGGVRNSSGVAGEPEAIRTGAGARIDVDVSGDAKYIGVGSEGLSELRTAVENDRKRAQIKAGELVQSAGSQQESGVALSTRFTAQTATLNHIALSGAGGLENALRQIAKWMGADPKKVKVTPNLEFINFALDGQNFLQIMTARSMGLPISLESLHAVMADRGLTVLDFPTEMAKIAEENKLIAKILPNASAPGAAPNNAPPTGPSKPVKKPAKKQPSGQ
jgi:hypothetical protein